MLRRSGVGIGMLHLIRALSKQRLWPRAPLELGPASALLVGIVSALAVVGICGIGLMRIEELTELTRGRVAAEPATQAFLASVGFLSLFFLALATSVAWVTSRSVDADVRYVAEGVRRMARRDAFQDPISIRTLDEAGALSQKFEGLRRHFFETLERDRLARRSAEEADRDATEFLRIVSHELRTPLNAVLGFTEVLLGEIEGPLTPAQREDLLMIRGAGQTLMSLFNDVLDLSAAASGRLELRRGAVEVAPVLARIAADLEGQRRGQAVNIRVTIENGLRQADADEKRLQQIVANLASNAVKFTEKGEIVLSAVAHGDEIEISVRDTGAGIAQAELARIFEDFAQAAGEGRRKRGSGLGLAIVRQLTELHGGTISVESSVGKGSTFTVRLPAWRVE